MSPHEVRGLRLNALASILPAVALAGSLALAVVLTFGLSPGYFVRTLVLATVGACIACAGLGAAHPFARFGVANQVTLVRAIFAVLLAALLGEALTPVLLWLAVLAATCAACLDAVDGRLARRRRMTSPFGARLDMETDALLILALSLLAWQLDKAGAWIIACGLLRYLFVAAGELQPWMARALPPSRRRQTIAALQMVCLIMVIAPLVSSPWSDAIGALALVTLLVSFAIDVAWLVRHRRAALPREAVVQTWLLPLVALLLLNGAVTFHNVWPTLFVHWPGELSIELAVTVLALALLALRGPLPRALLVTLAATWVVFALGRYAEITAPALYGREVNLYWDLQNLTSLAGMLGRVMQGWQVVAAVAAACFALALVYVVARWSFGRLDSALARPRLRSGLIAASLAAIAMFLVQRIDVRVPRAPQFSTSIAHTYAQQVRRVVATYAARGGLRTLPPSPQLDSSLAALAGTDVMLVFLESYGRVTYDRPQLAAALAPARERFAADVARTGHDVVSAFVHSPTFGGSSWLAHISLLSGIQVEDPDLYELLMTQQRPTFVTAMQRRGYRAVALMPGTRKAWPEGAFYGFDALYDAEHIEYRGPEFGWWRIPDQFALAQLDARELRGRQPLFVVFPTINTHMPFRPTPPYQTDWSRMLTSTPYDAQAQHAALAATAAWQDLQSSYGGAVEYTLQTLGGYLGQRETQAAARDVIMIVIGDHQPPAAVSGTNVSWDVPIHVIARNPRVLDALRARGFVDGLTPAGARVGEMSQVPTWLLAAFEGFTPPPPPLPAS